MKRYFAFSFFAACYFFIKPALSIDIRPLESTSVALPRTISPIGEDERHRLAVDGMDPLVFLLESEVLHKSEKSSGSGKLADVGGHYIVKSGVSAWGAHSEKKNRPFLGGVYNERQQIYGLATGEIIFRLASPGRLESIKAALPRRKVKCIGKGHTCLLSVESMSDVVPTVQLLSKVAGVSSVAPRVVYHMAKPL